MTIYTWIFVVVYGSLANKLRDNGHNVKTTFDVIIISLLCIMCLGPRKEDGVVRWLGDHLSPMMGPYHDRFSRQASSSFLKYRLMVDTYCRRSATSDRFSRVTGISRDFGQSTWSRDVNTLKPRQNDGHFTQTIFWNAFLRCVSIKISFFGFSLTLC